MTSNSGGGAALPTCRLGVVPALVASIHADVIPPCSPVDLGQRGGLYILLGARGMGDLAILPFYELCRRAGFYTTGRKGGEEMISLRDPPRTQSPALYITVYC